MPIKFGDVLDVIDIAIERAFFCSRADQDRIYADHSAPFADHLDLFITDVAFDVVIAAGVSVGHNRRLCGESREFLQTRLD